MKHIIIAPTLNEYDVDDEFFVTYEAGIPVYVFTVVEEHAAYDVAGYTTKTQLNTPVAAVVEMHGDYNEDFVDAMRTSSAQVLKAQMEQMKIRRQQQEQPEQPPAEGVEDHERRDYI